MMEVSISRSNRGTRKKNFLGSLRKTKLKKKSESCQLIFPLRGPQKENVDTVATLKPEMR